MSDYTDKHASAGIDAKLPADLKPGQTISRDTPLPRLSRISLRVSQDGHAGFWHSHHPVPPRKRCLELKALKIYLLAYRDLGIFYENAVNHVLRESLSPHDRSGAP